MPLRADELRKAIRAEADRLNLLANGLTDENLSRDTARILRYASLRIRNLARVLFRASELTENPTGAESPLVADLRLYIEDIQGSTDEARKLWHKKKYPPIADSMQRASDTAMLASSTVALMEFTRGGPR